MPKTVEDYEHDFDAAISAVALIEPDADNAGDIANHIGTLAKMVCMWKSRCAFNQALAEGRLELVEELRDQVAWLRGQVVPKGLILEGEPCTPSHGSASNG